MYLQRDTKLRNRRSLTTNILISIQTCILLRLCCAKTWKNLEQPSWYERWNLNLYDCIFFINIVTTALILSVCASKLWVHVLCNGWCHSPYSFNMETAVLQVKSFSHLPWVTWVSGRSRTCHPCPWVFIFFPATVSDCISGTVKYTDLQ